METILVTGVGGAGGIGAIRAIQRETAHEVVGVDMDPAAPGLHLADESGLVPPAAHERWPAAMRRLVDTHDVDVVVPLVDEELRRLPELSDALPGDVPVVAPRPDVVEVALDKYRTSQSLAAAGHTVPDTWLATEAERVPETAFPLVAKPRHGRGSRGVERLASPAELEAYLLHSDRERTEVVLQEYLSGTEFTTSVVATTDDRLLAVVPKEAIEKAGCTTRGVTRTAPAVAESCRRLFETLQPAGPMNVQQIVDDTGTPSTIEINPRFSSTACLTVAAGVDEFDLLVRDALGEHVSPPDGHEPDVHILRYSDHVFVHDDDLPEATRTHRTSAIDD